jgi:pimeloyl-ACP methyl ester carboxylesterase
VEPIEPGWFTPPAQKPILFPPSAIDLTYESVEFDVPDGRTLYGWFIPADSAPATVLINHGAVVNRSALFYHYRMIHDLGYNVLVYDYQGFGESPGFASLDTLVPDADAALNYLLSRSEPATDRIVLFGISLGTLPTLVQAARTPAGVIGVILDGSFEIESLPPTSYSAIGVVPFPEVLNRLYETYPELEPTQYVGHISLPKLFIQSPQDVTTPLVGAERLYELAPEPKQWCEVFGGHVLSSVLDADYADCVTVFLEDLTWGSLTDGD